MESPWSPPLQPQALLLFFNRHSHVTPCRPLPRTKLSGLMKMQRTLGRSNPPKILRQRIVKDFAVLLMRSSYAVTDALDIVAMNQFQRDFFLIRSAEYEPYVQSLGPGYVQQGDLSDPSYFDFISFAQYLTINRVLSDPASVFEELQPVKDDKGDDDNSDATTNNSPQRFETVMIRRTIPNDKLLNEFDARLGSAILRYMDDTYGGTASAIPVVAVSDGRPCTVNDVQAALTQLVKLFLINGFAWDGTVDVTLKGGIGGDSVLGGATTGTTATFCLTLVSPASIWGHQSLQRQRSPLRNDYLLKTAKMLVQRMGCGIVSSSVKIEGNKELNYLTIR
jgi:hypothetical protein